MTERAYRYGDPAKVIEMDESRTCKGCINLSRLWGIQYCLNDNNAHERRCQSYYNPTEREAHGAS